MIHNIRTAFNEILMASDWMDKETKKVAKEKANAMNERIGYPEFILDSKELDKIYDGVSYCSHIVLLFVFIIWIRFSIRQ